MTNSIYSSSRMCSSSSVAATRAELQNEIQMFGDRLQYLDQTMLQLKQELLPYPGLLEKEPSSNSHPPELMKKQARYWSLIEDRKSVV